MPRTIEASLLVKLYPLALLRLMSTPSVTVVFHYYNFGLFSISSG
ncbi:hypothetical protein HNQ73_000733 [Chelatococcus composti]|uniref:Uncharacterized protein n=1 Tax=Chelatococcus composti TaxID=1743235 RepID=A0A841K492_9HYPH|nr:hypothetical protein [Chelatococcus composti]